MTKDAGPVKNPKLEDTIYQFTAIDIDGREVKLSSYQGFVCIIVNTASKWGKTTENFVQLQEIFERYEGRGLKILAFPCSQFMQEPKSNEQIRKFVDSFDVNYDIFAKVS